jgi:hypothetical protein
MESSHESVGFFVFWAGVVPARKNVESQKATNP